MLDDLGEQQDGDNETQKSAHVQLVILAKAKARRSVGEIENIVTWKVGGRDGSRCHDNACRSRGPSHIVNVRGVQSWEWWKWRNRD